jgi:hypothetical protein
MAAATTAYVAWTFALPATPFAQESWYSAGLASASGTYVFLEHGRSAEPRVARLQDRLNPHWRRSGIGRGCNINRQIDSLIAQAGLQIVSLERYVLGRPRIMTEMYRRLATP